jgi:hypothetical protein
VYRRSSREAPRLPSEGPANSTSALVYLFSAELQGEGPAKQCETSAVVDCLLYVSFEGFVVYMNNHSGFFLFFFAKNSGFFLVGERSLFLFF